MMGTINHNCVIATTGLDKSVDRLNAWLEGRTIIEKLLVKKLDSNLNNIQTFIVMPDGSKEHWPESDVGDDFRKSFIAEIESHTYEDGSSPWFWVEVGYGEYGQKVLKGNCKPRIKHSDYS